MSENQTEGAFAHKNCKDISGRRFGNWKVIGRTKQTGASRNAMWMCVCDCGVRKPVLGTHLRAGRSAGCRSCSGAKISKSKTIHGECGCRTYSCWMNMRSRAASNKTLEARRYAIRNIPVCPAWSSYKSFVADMGHCPSDTHTIDRIDNTRGYSKENCRWATQTQQQRNKSSNRIVDYCGEALCVSEFAERLRLPYRLVADRIRSGWTTEQIATHYTKFG